VLTKGLINIFFDFPKSSFGSHKVVTKDHSIPEKPTHHMLLPVPEIPESRFIIFPFKRRFMPSCASFNRGFRGLVATIFCNHLAKFMLPKRRFSKAEPTFRTVFSKHFSMVSRPNGVLTYVKSALKTRSEIFVPSSKIFVWGA
jgi:hypothetical protein